MALFTKLFDRSHDPYSIPGARWYKITFTAATNDGPVIINQSRTDLKVVPVDYEAVHDDLCCFYDPEFTNLIVSNGIVLNPPVFRTKYGDEPVDDPNPYIGQVDTADGVRSIIRFEVYPLENMELELYLYIIKKIRKQQIV